ncbi:MAG: SIS domain-containing protein [Solirubrobacterales bacterium]|nr:SIS domain-containing protein [Solirubrobacterales bacterium]
MSGGAVMAAEMAEQPEVLSRLVAAFDDHAAAVAAALPADVAGVQLVARGSSDHAATYGRYLAELASGRPAGLVAPSLHARYDAKVDYRGHVVVALSQSGATPEVVDVTRRLAAAGAVTVAIVNDPDGPLAREAHVVIAVGAGPERAVPATKSVTAQFVATAAVAAALGPLPFATAELAALPGAVAAVLADPGPAEALARAWTTTDRLVVSGRGLLSAAAGEIALKVQETAGVLAEGLSSVDLLHGPIGATGPGVPVLVLDDDGPTRADAAELRRRLAGFGAPVGELPLDGGVPWGLAPVVAIARGQQLALALARARGRDADAPPGLLKVTATT